VFGGITVTIEYLHASKFGNGATVAARFKEQMAADGVQVDVHHIREMRPAELSSADLYVFSSPGRIGKPIRAMRRFLKKVSLPAGSRYAILTTEAMPKPDKKTGRVPTEEELAKYQRVRPIMNELLQGKGLVKLGEDKIHVTGLKGPLEDGWETKVDAFAAAVCSSLGHAPAAPGAHRGKLHSGKAAV
jgi:menaquinone-dependent protoporphyrinogen IX oxidase